MHVSIKLDQDEVTQAIYEYLRSKLPMAEISGKIVGMKPYASQMYLTSLVVDVL